MTPSYPKQKWLLITYIFNVDGKAASQTITDRIPLFIQKGISLTVLSGPTGKKDSRFPHFRIMSCMPSGLQYELRFLLKKSAIQKWLQQSLKALVSLIIFPLYLLERIIIHLDTHWSWGISASIFGIYHLFHNRPDIIYSTAGPSSTHLTGYLLHKLSGIPWIAEMHDPLIYDTKKRKWHQRYLFNNWLESKICSHAAAVIYFTEHALESANRRHPMKGSKNIIRPGAAFPFLNNVTYKKQKKIHFAHFGSLATTRNLSQLIEAFYLLSNEQPTLNKQIVLDIYGSGLDRISRQSLEVFPLDNILQEHGRLEYNSRTQKSGRQQVLEAMCRCDVQIILHGTGLISDEYIPSKVYEYLLTGRPILALTSATSELGQIVLECGHQVIDPDNPLAIKDMLMEYISIWKSAILSNSKTPSPYTIEKTVQKLFGIANQITK